MGNHYPPLSPDDLAKLKRALGRLLPQDQEDAIQEAWLAHLENRNPVCAVEDYIKRERLHHRREIPLSQLQ